MPLVESKNRKIALKSSVLRATDRASYLKPQIEEEYLRIVICHDMGIFASHKRGENKGNSCMLSRP